MNAVFSIIGINLERDVQNTMDDDDEPVRMSMLSAFAATKSNQNVNNPGITNMLGVCVLTKDQATANAGVTQHHRDHNAAVMSSKQYSVGRTILKDLPQWDAKSQVLGPLRCFQEAEAAAKWLETHTKLTHDERTGSTMLSLAIGNTTHVGYTEYGATFALPIAGNHDKDAQQSSTVLLKRPVFTVPMKACTPLHLLEEAIRTMLQEDTNCNVHLIQSHVLRQGDLHACPSSHLDSVGDTKKSHLSVLVNLSNTSSSMFMVGAESHFEYTSMGEYCVFPSDMFHYTSSACMGTVKIAFFYELEEKYTIDGTADDEASTSGVNEEETKHAPSPTPVKAEAPDPEPDDAQPAQHTGKAKAPRRHKRGRS